MTDEQKKQKAEFNLRIGQRVAQLRKQNGMTQEELSLRAGLQRSHIAKVERGVYDVTAFTIQLIAEALGMTVDIIDPKLANLTPLTPLT
jgi:transcriptional regulator with XRE-family HTH domain